MKVFSILLVFLLFFLANGNAQSYYAGTILNGYYDVNPDTSLEYQYPYKDERFNINMFGTSGDELRIQAFCSAGLGGGSFFISVKPLIPNLYLTFGRWDSLYHNFYNYWMSAKIAKPLNLGDSLNKSTFKWDTTSMYITNGSGLAGTYFNVTDWLGATDKYIGLKYHTGTTIEYGWIRLNCLNGAKCYVKDYSATVNFSGVSELSKSQLSFYPNPSNGLLYINCEKEKKADILSITVTNVLGEKIPVLIEDTSIGYQLFFSENLTDGYYLVNMRLNSGIMKPYKVVISKH